MRFLLVALLCALSYAQTGCVDASGRYTFDTQGTQARLNVLTQTGCEGRSSDGWEFYVDGTDIYIRRPQTEISGVILEDTGNIMFENGIVYTRIDVPNYEWANTIAIGELGVPNCPRDNSVMITLYSVCQAVASKFIESGFADAWLGVRQESESDVQEDSVCFFNQAQSKQVHFDAEYGATSRFICWIISDPTISPSMYPTFSYPSLSPTASMPTCSPTTSTPSLFPTKKPSYKPTAYGETLSPTVVPSLNPTFNPSVSPTNNPTICPTYNPTYSPSIYPTDCPSLQPTVCPTRNPSHGPSVCPTTESPSKYPTHSPSISIPTHNPSTSLPTPSPTLNPSHYPSKNPTPKPKEASVQLELKMDGVTADNFEEMGPPVKSALAKNTGERTDSISLHWDGYMIRRRRLESDSVIAVFSAASNADMESLANTIGGIHDADLVNSIAQELELAEISEVGIIEIGEMTIVRIITNPPSQQPSQMYVAPSVEDDSESEVTLFLSIFFGLILVLLCICIVSRELLCKEYLALSRDIMNKESEPNRKTNINPSENGKPTEMEMISSYNADEFDEPTRTTSSAVTITEDSFVIEEPMIFDRFTEPEYIREKMSQMSLVFDEIDRQYTYATSDGENSERSVAGSIHIPWGAVPTAAGEKGSHARMKILLRSISRSQRINLRK